MWGRAGGIAEAAGGPEGRTVHGRLGRGDEGELLGGEGVCGEGEDAQTSEDGGGGRGIGGRRLGLACCTTTETLLACSKESDSKKKDDACVTLRARVWEDNS